MQLSIIEYGRNVLGLENANSVEFDPNCENPMIYLIDQFIDQNGQKQLRTTNSTTCIVTGKQIGRAHV